MDDDWQNIPSAQLMLGGSHWYDTRKFNLDTEDNSDDSIDMPLPDMDESEHTPHVHWANDFDAPMSPR